MLGLEHKTNRGSIILEYYGRDVGIKIMPTGTEKPGSDGSGFLGGGNVTESKPLGLITFQDHFSANGRA